MTAVAFASDTTRMTTIDCEHLGREFGAPRHLTPTVWYLPWECADCHAIGMMKLPSQYEGILGSRVAGRVQRALADSALAQSITVEQWSLTLFNAFFGSVGAEHGPTRKQGYRVHMASLVEQLKEAFPIALREMREQAHRETYDHLTERVAELQQEIAALEKRRNSLDKAVRRRRVKLETVVAEREPETGLPVIATSRGVWTRRYVVYVLVDEREPDRVRYVGQSINAAVRFLGHCNSQEPQMRAWMESVRDAGAHVLMRMVEQCESLEHLGASERRWIRHYRELGMADINRSIPRTT